MLIRCRKYGVTLPEMEALLAAAGGRCQGCNEPAEESGLCVDHCHATGRIRGLICRNCNFALGHGRDKPALLRRLADYLDGAGQGRLN